VEQLKHYYDYVRDAISGNIPSIHLYFDITQRKAKEQSWTKRLLNTDIRP